jgi:hypothetical protein
MKKTVISFSLDENLVEDINTYNGTVTCPDGTSGCDCEDSCYDATAQLSLLLIQKFLSL